MTWLALAYFISAGTLNYGLIYPSINTEQAPHNSYQTTLGAEFQGLNNHIFIGGAVETWEAPGISPYFDPWESLYTFSAGFRFHGFELGFSHECDHITKAVDTIPIGFYVSREEFYFRYKSSVNIFWH